MGAPTRPVIKIRSDQMLPTLEPREIERLRRFGEHRTVARPSRGNELSGSS